MDSSIADDGVLSGITFKLKLLFQACEGSRNQSQAAVYMRLDIISISSTSFLNKKARLFADSHTNNRWALRKSRNWSTDFLQQNKFDKQTNNKTKTKPRRDDWSQSLIALCYHRQSKTGRIHFDSLP